MPQKGTAMTWAAYREAAERRDMLASFDAIVALGMRPVVIGECHVTGKIKRPIGNAWGKEPVDERRRKLEGFLAESVPIGIGCQADGYVVLDIDPPGKDRSNLLPAWKETASLLFGGEDWPDTTIIGTQAGCHVWFKSTPEIDELWRDRGKLEMKLPSGGKVEFFTGNDKQIQVACPPSEGKEFKNRKDPILIPESAAAVILDILQPHTADDAVPVQAKPTDPATPFATKWFQEKILELAGSVVNAAEGYRHDTYRKCVRTVAGYAAGLNLESMAPLAYTMLSTAHRTAKPEVTDYVLDATFRWAWQRGVSMPLSDPMLVHFAQQAAETESIIEQESEAEAANVETILALKKERTWVWGDPKANVGWIVKRGLHLIEGKEGTGKTRFILDLKRRWGLCLPWPDGQPASMDQDEKILFVAADSHFDQIADTCVDFGIDPRSVIFTGPESHPYEFTTLDDPLTIKLIRHWCNKYSVGMVVIDTLMAASALPLVDPQEVAKLARPLRELARELNIAIILVGHLNSQGETWGRAIGRQCDNVIRMEACEHDEQRITIRSVKARWNRFDLPTIEGTQSETGWNYNQKEPGQGVAREMLKREIAENIVRGFLKLRTRAKTQEIVDHVTTSAGVSHQTVRDVVANLKGAGEIISEGDKPTYYRINPKFNPSGP
jgi:hypothetical protein